MSPRIRDPFSRRSRRALAAVVALAMPASLAAQFPDDARDARASGPPIAAWASAALGSGSVHGARSGLFAGTLRGNVSAGPWLVTYRSADVGPFMSSGSGLSDEALLVGVRSPNRRAFLSGTVGYDRVRPYHKCEGCQPTYGSGTVSALAYDFSLHANIVAVGVVATLAGAAGPAPARYSTFVVGLELGWFGL